MKSFHLTYCGVILAAVVAVWQIQRTIHLSVSHENNTYDLRLAGHVPLDNYTQVKQKTKWYTKNGRDRLIQKNKLAGNEKALLPTAATQNEIEYDLIFWFRTPFWGDDFKSYKFLVTRSDSKNSKSSLSPPEEVLRVDFRLCNQTCPLATTSDITNLLQYKKNKNRLLKIYSTNIMDSLTKDFIEIGKLQVITFWSYELQQHVPIKQYHATRIQWTTCMIRDKGDCPKPCPQNHHSLEYPYHYDRADKICKSSHPDAIPPRRMYGGMCTCDTTCFTPEAGELNSTWPWKNAVERDQFAPHWNNTDEAKKIKTFYKQSKLQRLTVETYRSYRPRFGCDSDNVKTPDAIMGDFQHHLFFLPQAKLIFCGIPKVGVTEWVKFFRHVMGANDYLSLPHFKEDRVQFFMKSLESSKAEELLNDPTWTKAFFIRDPLERLLSAYMDKIVGQSFTQKVFKIGNLSEPKSERFVLNFTEFVDKIANNTNTGTCEDPTGLKACTDSHWKPQLMTCGLDYLLPKFDFIGNFNHLSKHTKILLERVHLWEKYGATFDDGEGLPPRETSICYVPPPNRPVNQSIRGFNQQGPSKAGNHRHSTGSKSRLAEYYTPELIAKVRDAYALDFAVWDEISTNNEEEISNGKTLKIVQEYCTSQKYTGFT